MRAATGPWGDRGPPARAPCALGECATGRPEKYPTHGHRVTRARARHTAQHGAKQWRMTHTDPPADPAVPGDVLTVLHANITSATPGRVPPSRPACRSTPTPWA